MIIGRAFILLLTLRVSMSLALAHDGSAEPSPGADAATLKRILANWNAQEDRVKTFHFVTRVRLTLLKGTIDNLREPERKGQVFYCDKDVVYEHVDETWVDGDNRCRNESGEFLNPPPANTARPGRVALRTTFDGKDFTWLIIGPLCRGPRHSTSGFVRGVVEKMNVADRRLDEPFRFAFRASHPATPWRADNCRVITENGIIDGVRYTEIERSVSGGRRRGPNYCRAWVDPRRDDVVVYWEERDDPLDAWTWHGSIDYRKDPKYGWIPSHWKSSCPGPQARTEDCTVIRYAINQKLSPELFAPKLPPGTPVRDRTSGQQYVVEKDGSKRMITREEVKRLWQPFPAPK
jgi:hypothetical protein